MVKSKKFVLINIISIVIFIVILLEVIYRGFLINVDYGINNFILLFENNFTYGLSNILAFIFDTLSIMLITLVLCIYFWFRYQRKKESIFFACTMVLTAVITLILKETVKRARPFNALVNENTFSFPSGHVTASVVFFGLLCYIVLRNSKSYAIKLITILISGLFVLLISFSRLFLNVHWFSDILGGLFLGLFISSGCIIVFEYLWGDQNGK